MILIIAAIVFAINVGVAMASHNLHSALGWVAAIVMTATAYSAAKEGS